MQDRRELLLAIEELLDTQIERTVKQLIQPYKREDDITNERLHALRGAAHALTDFQRTLRSTLGYHPRDL